MQTQKRLRVLMIAGITIPISFLALSAWDSGRSVIRDVDQEITSTLRLLAEHTEKTMKANELTIRLVNRATRGMSWQEIRSSASIREYLHSIIRSSYQVAHIQMTTLDGEVMLTTGDAHEGTPQRYLDYVNHFKKQVGTTRPLISDSYTAKQLSGKHALNPFFDVVWKRTLADGGFDGLIIVANRPEYFQDFYQSVGLNAPVVSLTHQHGGVLARQPRAGSTADKPERFARPNKFGNFGIVSSVDGITRRGDTMPVAGYPLNVNYGVSVKALRTAWFSAVSAYAALTLMGIGFFAAATGFTRQSLAREKHTTTMLVRAQRRQFEAESRYEQKTRLDAIGQLTAGVAHEFNNMLMVLMGSLEMLERKLRDGEQNPTKLLSRMQQACERASVLTRQMLSYGRRQILRPVKCELNGYLMRMGSLTRSTATEGLTLVYELSSKKLFVCIDPSEMDFLLINIATNARYAMSNGGVLRLSTMIESLDGADAEKLDLPIGKYAKVSFSDEGHGMSAQVLSHATEPFFSTRNPGHGSGLGLSQAYGFARQSDGTLILESEEGRGTTVHLYLPLISISEAASEPVVPQGPSRLGEVVVVDDSPMVLDSVVETMASLGYVVYPAENGDQALGLLEQHPDVVLLLTDILMPGVSGLELAKQVRARNESLAIVLMTGYASEDHDFPLLQKPFTNSKLVQVVNSILAHEESGASK